VRGHRLTFDTELPSAHGPRALLRAQFANAAQGGAQGWRWFPHFPSVARITGLAAGLLAVVVAGGLLLRFSAPRKSTAALDRGALPERTLTPGATRSVDLSEVCSVQHEEVVREVSEPMRNEVLRHYGIREARAGDYEIDYLIAPGLGGAEDLRNLWPEPTTSGAWNSGVKDDLEERLHQMVCSGTLDLPTAQHDIATDWIEAYKKYFHTDAPLAIHARLISVPSSRV